MLLISHNFAYFLCLLLICCHTAAIAQRKNIDSVLARIIESPVTTPALKTDPSQRRSYLVKLHPGIKKETLLHTGIAILRTIDQRLLIIEATHDKLAQSVYEQVWPVNHLWKLSDELLLQGDTAQKNYYTIRVSNTSAVRAIASIPDITFISSTNNILTIFASLASILAHVIRLDEVHYIGIEALTPHTESPVPDLNINPNTINRIHHVFPDLNGQGMTVSIQEQPYNPEDIDIQGRHISSSLNTGQTSNHATEMATIAAGAGYSFVTGKGVAWAATITSSGFEDLLPDKDEAYTLLNTWVQNHSYGTVIENFYGTRAEAFDQSANRNPTLLHVFSSGNEGYTTSTIGPYQGIKELANLTGNFKMAKNSLIVGSVDTVGRPIAFSSRGPAYDGRIKPEVVAYSTAGSSNSAALVSGISVLLQQAYQQKESALPASALLKALLINSAQDAGPVGVDYITGFGNVDAYRTLLNLTEQHYFSGSIQQGEKKNFNLHIPANSSHLKITLVWNDPAALPNANLALVNDLDIKLKHTMGNTWLPWILDASADETKLTKPAVRGEDHLNNIEQITVDKVIPGTYTISIEGFDVSSGPQEFYIAYQWDTLHRFEWAYPTGSDNMPFDGETDTYFYWKSTLPDTIGKLEYTLDEGITWQTIVDTIHLKKGYYRWHVPEINARAMARMVVGSSYYTTDHFTISRPVRLTIGYSCADSLLIQWPLSAGIKEYELYTFQNTHPSPFLVTTDTVVVLKKAAFSSQQFAVRPVLDEGVYGIRGRILNYSSLTSSCYLVSFYGEVVADQGINLVTQLGTTYGIERVLIERENDGQFQPIGSVRPHTEIRFMDDHPKQGLNLHRIRVQLVNRQEIISEAVASYYLTETPFFVFPNPVARTDKLTIFSKEFNNQEVVLRLYGVDGKLMLTAKLLSDREYIPLSNLSPGLYMYSIQTNEGYFNGKVIIK